MIKGPVVVTGGSGGIGSWVVRAFREFYSRTNVLFPPLHVPGHADLPHYAPLREARVLVCCHAAPPGTPLLELLQADVVLAAECAREMAAGIAARGERGGRIVLLSSIRSHAPRPAQADYATAKAAIEGLTRGLAVELGPLGISVNCIAPGAVETPRTLANIERGVVSRAELEGRTPLGCLAEPDDVAATVLFLSSHMARTITGQRIVVDGGWSVSG